MTPEHTEDCLFCDGEGQCQTCHGRGTLRDHEVEIHETNCPTCGGSGQGGCDLAEALAEL